MSVKVVNQLHKLELRTTWKCKQKFSLRDNSKCTFCPLSKCTYEINQQRDAKEYGRECAIHKWYILKICSKQKVVHLELLLLYKNKTVQK